MCEAPTAGDCLELTKQPLRSYRRRVGDWRIFFDLYPERRLFVVTTIEQPHDDHLSEAALAPFSAGRSFSATGRRRGGRTPERRLPRRRARWAASRARGADGGRSDRAKRGRWSSAPAAPPTPPARCVGREARGRRGAATPHRGRERSPPGRGASASYSSTVRSSASTTMVARCSTHFSTAAPSRASSHSIASAWAVHPLLALRLPQRALKFRRSHADRSSGAMRFTLHAPGPTGA